MIDLSFIRAWGSTLAALLFFVLWRVAEHKESRALNIAEGTVATTRECVADYRGYADSLGKEVHRLTWGTRS